MTTTSTTTSRTAAARTVACPRCGAAANKGCVDGNGRPASVNGVAHRERLRAADRHAAASSTRAPSTASPAPAKTARPTASPARAKKRADEAAPDGRTCDECKKPIADGAPFYCESCLVASNGTRANRRSDEPIPDGACANCGEKPDDHEPVFCKSCFDDEAKTKSARVRRLSPSAAKFGIKPETLEQHLDRVDVAGLDKAGGR